MTEELIPLILQRAGPEWLLIFGLVWWLWSREKARDSREEKMRETIERLAMVIERISP